MKKLSSHEIRERFLKFFEEKDHLRIPGASILPKNDPTLLYINSGMAPLKRYFLGKAQPPKPRLANVQPCIRTKDIDDVGDRHHLTLFEMLGSWSIGDYYKELAVELAYELLVDRLGFDPKRLWVTVYGGDPKQGLPPDDESAKYWERCGIARDHILALGQDNFWGPAGDTGPCGPCTEVFFDCGPKFGPEYKQGDEWITTGRYIEIWNAGVFMQYNKVGEGKFNPLPLKSVDTGSGLERMAMVINDVESAYETDLLKPMLDHATKQFAGPGMGVREFRILADHMKASTFMLSEGVIPGNEGQGYIPRRLIRKCIALAVKAKRPTDFSPMVEAVIANMGEYYPHLKQNRDRTLKNFMSEVSEFTPVITQGLKLLDDELGGTKGKIFSGKISFDLVTTHGVPLEVIRSHLAERQMTVDEQGFEKHFREHQEVSRQGKKSVGDGVPMSAMETRLQTASQGIEATEFVGYDSFEGDGKILSLVAGDAIAKDISKAGESFLLVADRTPFYGESGGQVGDVGIIKTDSGEAEIVDTKKSGDVHVHLAKLVKGSIKTGQKAHLLINGERRLKIRRNHSVTHLLHAALHSVLGPHALQKGSLVDDARTRFDFNHTQAMTQDEIEKVEALVNEWIWEGHPRDAQIMSMDDAMEKGAMALFGENYGDQVRVVKFGGRSTELCGGTHVENTGEIGLFVITSESSVAKGIRRLEAVTGPSALNEFHERRRTVKSVVQTLGVNEKQILERLEQMRKAGSGKDKSAAAPAASVGESSTLKLKGDVTLFVAKLDGNANSLKEFAEQKLQKKEAQVVCLTGLDDGAARVLVMVDKKSTDKINAANVLQRLMPYVDGRGGGKPNYAMGGGKKVEGIGEILKNAGATVESLLA